MCLHFLCIYSLNWYVWPDRIHLNTIYNYFNPVLVQLSAVPFVMNKNHLNIAHKTAHNEERKWKERQNNSYCRAIESNHRFCCWFVHLTSLHVESTETTRKKETRTQQSQK